MLGGVAVLRRLAAIGAEVPSCLRTVKADRDGTRADLEKPRHDPIDPKIASRRGRTLKPAAAVEPAPIPAV
jgi:hypothetical protein